MKYLLNEYLPNIDYISNALLNGQGKIISSWKWPSELGDADIY